MANLNGVESFHEFHEFQRRFRRKYGQRFKELNHFLRAKNGYVARKLKKMAYVSFSG